MSLVRILVGMVVALAVIAGSFALADVIRGGSESDVAAPAPRGEGDLTPWEVPLGGNGAGSARQAGSAESVGTAERQRTLAEIDRLIAVFEVRVEETVDGLNEQFLGQLLLRKALLTGDVATYARAEDRLSSALEIGPDNLDVMTMLGSARAALHDFAGAAALAERVLTTEADRVEALALLGDAKLALGDDEAAEAAFEDLQRKLPDHPAVNVRLSWLAYLRGDADTALARANDAVSGSVAARRTGADLAWYHAYAGQLQFDLGRDVEATRQFETALEADSEFVAALEGLARTHAGQGRVDEAVELYERAIEQGPDPHLHALLGDLYLIRGDVDAAEEQYLIVEEIGEEFAGFAAYDRDIAIFHADRDRDVAEALRLATKDLEARQDPFAYDTYAWALYRNGRFAEARQASDRVLTTGPLDAPMWYHAGLISAALDETDRAVSELERALEINPGFDPLLAAHARATLDSLTS